MTARALAALPAVALAAAWLAAGAAGYGTSTTYASQSAGTPPGAWSSVAGAGSASDGDAAATLTETDAGGLAATSYPSNGSFAGSAAGWAVSDDSGALCSVASGHEGADGSPPGSIRTSYSTLLNLGGLLASCDSTWTSESFSWTGDVPSAVAFRMDRMVDTGGLVGPVTATWQAVLVDETVPGWQVLLTGSAAADSGWTTQTAVGLGPSAIVPGRSYHLRIVIAFESSLSLASGIGVGIDEVALEVTPQAHHAQGELRTVGVLPGTTQTLEMRARTSGEPFAAEVWDGASWSPWTTIGSTSYDTASLGLTAQQSAGGTVRVRFTATGTGADAVADALEVEYLRVVSTGGATISGPTSVTLPEVVIDGVTPVTTTTPLGTVEVVDGGGAAPGWELTATATRWALDGEPGEMLPADAFWADPAPPTTPDGSDMTGVWAGAGGTLDPVTPVTLMGASEGHGIGTFRENPTLSLVIPVTALHGVYRSDITLSAS